MIFLFFKIFVAIKIAVFWSTVQDLCTFSTDPPCQLDILWHNGDTFSVDSAQVGIFEKTNQVSLRCFLESHYSRTLESEISLEVLGDFTNKTLERQFSDEELGGFLVSSDFTKGNSTRSVTMWLLDSTSSWCWLSCSFCGQLFSWSLASSGFSCSLLGSCHFEVNFVEIRRNSLAMW